MATNPRIRFAEIIENISGSTAIENFAVFLRQETIDGRTPCWGAIAEYFQDTFSSEDDRLLIWPAVRTLDDIRVTGLFVTLNTEYAAVMTQVIHDIEGLPAWIQKALVCRTELHPQLQASKEKLHPQARQLLDSDEAAIAKEGVVVYAKINQLLSYKYFAPDVVRPGEVGQ